MYKFYSGYPGGLKEKSFERVMKDDPTFALMHAVKGMLPKSKLGAKLLKKLKVYADENHPHKAQNPKLITV